MSCDLHSPPGKGPLREHYEQCIAKKNFSHVTIKTIWLSAEDYPLMLGERGTVQCVHGLGAYGYIEIWLCVVYY